MYSLLKNMFDLKQENKFHGFYENESEMKLNGGDHRPPPELGSTWGWGLDSKGLYRGFTCISNDQGWGDGTHLNKSDNLAAHDP